MLLYSYGWLLLLVQYEYCMCKTIQQYTERSSAASSCTANICSHATVLCPPSTGAPAAATVVLARVVDDDIYLLTSLNGDLSLRFECLCTFLLNNCSK